MKISTDTSGINMLLPYPKPERMHIHVRYEEIKETKEGEETAGRIESHEK